MNLNHKSSPLIQFTLMGAIQSRQSPRLYSSQGEEKREDTASQKHKTPKQQQPLQEEEKKQQSQQHQEEKNQSPQTSQPQQQQTQQTQQPKQEKDDNNDKPQQPQPQTKPQTKPQAKPQTKQPKQRRSTRTNRTPPQRFVARPSKQGVGVEEGDAAYLVFTATTTKTTATITTSSSSSAHGRGKDMVGASGSGSSGGGEMGGSSVIGSKRGGRGRGGGSIGSYRGKEKDEGGKGGPASKDDNDAMEGGDNEKVATGGKDGGKADTASGASARGGSGNGSAKKRSRRDISPPDRYVARPSKQGLGVEEGDAAYVPISDKVAIAKLIKNVDAKSAKRANDTIGKSTKGAKNAKGGEKVYANDSVASVAKSPAKSTTPGKKTKAIKVKHSVKAPTPKKKVGASSSGASSAKNAKQQKQQQQQPKDDQKQKQPKRQSRQTHKQHPNTQPPQQDRRSSTSKPSHKVATATQDAHGSVHRSSSSFSHLKRKRPSDTLQRKLSTNTTGNSSATSIGKLDSFPLSFEDNDDDIMIPEGERDKTKKISSPEKFDATLHRMLDEAMKPDATTETLRDILDVIEANFKNSANAPTHVSFAQSSNPNYELPDRASAFLKREEYYEKVIANGSSFVPSFWEDTERFLEQELNASFLREVLGRPIKVMRMECPVDENTGYASCFPLPKQEKARACPQEPELEELDSLMEENHADVIFVHSTHRVYTAVPSKEIGKIAVSYLREKLGIEVCYPNQFVEEGMEAISEDDVRQTLVHESESDQNVERITNDEESEGEEYTNENEEDDECNNDDDEEFKDEECNKAKSNRDRDRESKSKARYTSNFGVADRPQSKPPRDACLRKLIGSRQLRVRMKKEHKTPPSYEPSISPVYHTTCKRVFDLFGKWDCVEERDRWYGNRKTKKPRLPRLSRKELLCNRETFKFPYLLLDSVPALPRPGAKMEKKMRDLKKMIAAKFESDNRRLAEEVLLALFYSLPGALSAFIQDRNIKSTFRLFAPGNPAMNSSRPLSKGSIGVQKTKPLHDDRNALFILGVWRCIREDRNNPVFFHFMTTHKHWCFEASTDRIALFNGLIPHKTTLGESAKEIPSSMKRMHHTCYMKPEVEYIGLALCAEGGRENLILDTSICDDESVGVCNHEVSADRVKPVFCIGQSVVARRPKKRGDRNWFFGRVCHVECEGCSKDYGAVRKYGILFHDGGIESVYEESIMLEKDYDLNCQRPEEEWVGVKNFVDVSSKDFYAKLMGWYEFETIYGEKKVFTSLTQSLRAYDEYIIGEKGLQNVTPRELNFPM